MHKHIILLLILVLYSYLVSGMFSEIARSLGIPLYMWHGLNSNSIILMGKDMLYKLLASCPMRVLKWPSRKLNRANSSKVEKCRLKSIKLVANRPRLEC